jgi:REP element-mobilizing transposase RayT
MQETAKLFNVIVYGYCLMNNHFHLLIQTLNPNISQFMQRLQGGYANWFRTKYGQVGPLFQGRYKSILVEDESYLVTLSAYIHLNPVRAKMVERAAEYKWSSCSVYLGNVESELINPKPVLSSAGGVENYKYILAGMLNEPPEKEAIYGKYSLLGNDAFKEKIVRQHQKSTEKKKKPRHAQPDYRKLTKRSVRSVRDAVSDVMGVSHKILIAKTQNNIARKMYGLMLKREAQLFIAEVADIMQMKPLAAGDLIRRFEKQLLQSKDLQKKANDIRRKLYETEKDT